MPRKKNNMTEKEMLDLLKKEIDRLGLTDNPSRTKVQNNFDKDRCPSPTTIMFRTGKTWKEIMEEIGLEYDSSVKGKVKPAKWNSKSDAEIKEIVIDEFNRIGSNKIIDYQEERDKDVSPSTLTLVKRFESWENVASWWKENLKLEKGDIIIVDFGQGIGDEKRGKRPAVIISNNVMNNTSNNILVAPLTDYEHKMDESHKVNLLPWQTYLSAKHYKLKKSSVVQLEDIRSISKKRVESRIVDRLSESSLKDIERKLSQLFYFNLNKDGK